MNFFFQEISRTTRSSVSQINQQLKPFGITYSQWVFIVYLSKWSPSPLAPIARYYRIEKPAITQIKKHFFDLGWIEEIPSADRRERPVQLTKIGLTQFKKINSAVRALEALFLSDLTEKEQSELVRILTKLNTKELLP